MNHHESLPPARWQESIPDGRARCLLCPNHCVLKPGETSRCRSRVHADGMLRIRNYGKVTSIALDPVEKKPLCAFHPGRRILSAGTFGCNLCCPFCQNWRISQEEAAWRDVPPEQLVHLAAEMKEDGNIGIAFTYNEPTIWYEYVLDTAQIAQEADLAIVLVTNGYINPEPLAALLPYVDAMNIDLKAFHPGFYRDVCKGRLEPVLETIQAAHAACHIELTTLVIPGLNDAEEEIDALARWVAALSPRIPLHLSRHHPDWKMREPGPIEVERLFRLSDIARRHLETVRVGNV